MDKKKELVLTTLTLYPVIKEQAQQSAGLVYHGFSFRYMALKLR